MTVLVLGGGYGGRRLCRRLLRAGLEVRLVDRWPFHTLKTELHRLAAGSAAPEEVTVPFPHRVYLGFRQGEVERLAPGERAVWVGGERLSADFLVVALGSEVRTFGVPQVAERALTVEGFGLALAAGERLVRLADGSRVAIVGGGLTGVELAAELRERRPGLAVVLREALPEVVPAFPQHVKDYVAATLRSLGAELQLGQPVRSLDELAADEVVWAAGVQPVGVVREAGFTVERDGRVRVDASGEAAGFPGVFVIGDCAAAPFPPSAQLAERQASIAARAIIARAGGASYQPEPLRLQGVVASLGHREGFASFFGGLVGTPARKLKTVVEWLYRWQARP